MAYSSSNLFPSLASRHPTEFSHTSSAGKVSRGLAKTLNAEPGTSACRAENKHVSKKTDHIRRWMPIPSLERVCLLCQMIPSSPQVCPGFNIHSRTFCSDSFFPPRDSTTPGSQPHPASPPQRVQLAGCSHPACLGRFPTLSRQVFHPSKSFKSKTQEKQPVFFAI